jgi:hypothetical protein
MQRKQGFMSEHVPNPELDDRAPLDLLANTERQIVADFVDDMLTGAPA